MSVELRTRFHRRGELIHAGLDRSILASGVLIGTLLMLLILYLGVWTMAR